MFPLPTKFGSKYGIVDLGWQRFPFGDARTLAAAAAAPADPGVQIPEEHPSSDDGLVSVQRGAPERMPPCALLYWDAPCEEMECL
jgi:hypothetical protein